jgi:FkbM family methyltransferase
MQVMDLWEDELSRQEYLAQIKARTWLDFELPPSAPGETQYFPPQMYKFLTNEVFIDCGAFTGDTLDTFLHLNTNFQGEIYAFEPDPENYVGLQEYILTLDEKLQQKVSTFPYAVGEVSQKLRFSASGKVSAMVDPNGTAEVESVSLDETLRSGPTFIKMDIEGYELNALQGAAAGIRQSGPVLAICVYHQMDHLWKIPLFIHSLREDYHFFLRRYLTDMWETVCYCIPNSRLVTPER